MTQRFPGKLGKRSTLMVGLSLLCPSSAPAQWFDAQAPHSGELQLSVDGQSTNVERIFKLDGSASPLRDIYSVQLDPRLVPQLERLDATLGGLFASLGLPAPAPTVGGLGTVSYDVLLERTRVPITASFGATNWLAGFVSLPIVRGKSFVATMIDSLSAEAGPAATAFGEDPDVTFAALGSGIAQLESMIAADTLTPNRRSEAEALVSTARTLETGLLDLRGLQYVSTSSSVSGQALVAFYEELRNDFGGFQVSLPDLALARPLTPEEAVPLSSGPEFGIRPPKDRDTGIKLGDIEVGISLQPINTFRLPADQGRPFFLLRARLDALWRFPSGTPPAPDRISDPGTGDGQADLELRGALDAAFGERFWLSVAGAYNIQMEGEVERLITAPEAPIQLGASPAPVLWDPGDVLTLVVMPRFNLTRTITFSGIYMQTHHGKDRVRAADSSAGGNSPFSPSDLERGTEYDATALGFAVRYATTDWTGETRQGIPVDVELRYRKTRSASGGLAPERSVWEVSMRYYVALLR